jgi:PAS domain S-box-containing protein
MSEPSRVEDLEKEIASLRAELVRLSSHEQSKAEGPPRVNWRFLTDNLPDLVLYQLHVDIRGSRQFTYISPGVEAIHGLSPAQVYADASNLYAQVHPEDAVRFLDAEAAAQRTATPFACEMRICNSQGQVRWVLIRSAPMIIQGGTLWEGVEIDVTERKISEETLRASEDRFRSIVDQSPLSIMVLSPTGDALHVNEALCRLWGVSKDFILGRGFNIFSDPQSQSLGLTPYFERAFAGEQLSIPPVEYDLSATLGAGKTKIVRGDLYPIRNAKGALDSVILVHEDVTQEERHAQEQRRLQDQLQQAMKMEAVGRLAGGVAHDFNNLLTVIMGSLEFAKLDMHRTDLLPTYLADIEKAAKSASALVRQLLAFSRRQIIEPRVLHLNELAREMKSMLARLVGEDIEVELGLAATFDLVKIDPGQFEQVIVNLAVNARDAMPNGGRLLIETEDKVLDAEYCHHHQEARPGPAVMLAISDTGHGMNDDVKKHVFEPFFTTKPQGRGTGLGLATAFGTVKQAGGSIDFYSEEGTGTTIKIYLPIAEGQAAGPALPKTPSVFKPSQQRTILIVEDDASVRALAVALTERLGYRALSAPNAEAAILLSATHQGVIDLLMTDVVMPGMNGHQLATRLTEQRPGLVILFSSGFTQNVIAHHGVVDEGMNFISKPYSIATLEAKLRELLGATHS